MQDRSQHDPYSLYRIAEKPQDGSRSAMSAAWGSGLPAGWSPAARVVALGVFDGLHLGHRYLLECAIADAAEQSQPLLVVTFDRDPDEFFRPRTQGDKPERFKLMRNAERIEALQHFLESRSIELAARQHGKPLPLQVLLLPTGQELFEQLPEAFLDTLKLSANPSSVHVGEGFRYGAKAAGTTQTLAAWCAESDVACHVHPLYEADGLPVTSTRIRGLLDEGNVAKAAELAAGRYHAVCGRVVHGRGEGTGFGFATANLELKGTCRGVKLPAEGVYACYCSVDDVSYPAAVNVGVSKSFAGATAPLEAHLLGFEGDLYGKEVEVLFVEWLREPRVFESKEELISTVMGNIEWVRQHLGGGALGQD